MTFVAPGFLIASALVAVGAIILHFLVTQQPRSDVLPTVRFVPDVPARSTSVAIRPSDLLLLMLRLLIILLTGAAFAQPQLTPARTTTARIVAVDVSRAVAMPGDFADSARRYSGGRTSVIVFDSTARELTQGITDSLDDLRSATSTTSRTRGSFSSALVAALRVAARVREEADSLELVIISPFVNEAWDTATDDLRDLWPGRIQTVRVSGVAVNEAILPLRAPRVEWADSGRTTLWSARETPDTIGAVIAGDAVMVFPFERRWRRAQPVDTSAHVIARWMDGEPAALERTSGAECTRSIAIPMPKVGDAILRPDFARFLAALALPCREVHDFQPLSAGLMSRLEGRGALASTASIKSRRSRMTPLVPWILGVVLLLALLELFVRRRSGEPTAAAEMRRGKMHREPMP
ncbi:MAG: BatA domain-containing protein [Gemmatimonadaceae bacterium]|nr:BatA domain-containing protein [Gemmatimonadaceae bacterium]